MATPNRPAAQNKYPEQYIQNTSFDEDFNVLVTEPLGFDGQNLQRTNADNMQIYKVSDANYDYFCFAAPGTALADAKWRIFRIDGEANLMYADANANYDNVATDPTLLDYAYS